MDSFESILFGIFNSTGYEDRCGRDEINGYVIDTCDTVDQGYETAIWKKNDSFGMIIVQRYPNRKEALDGHKLWIEYCKLNPTGAYSVQKNKIVYFN